MEKEVKEYIEEMEKLENVVSRIINSIEANDTTLNEVKCGLLQLGVEMQGANQEIREFYE